MKLSPLAQGRGLKLVLVKILLLVGKSPLAQGSGLKLTKEFISKAP